jgi:hypothetical protein
MVMFAAIGLAGCAEPGAVVQLVGGVDQALVALADSDQDLRKAMLTQVDGQITALDAAFLSDMERLAAESGAVGIEALRQGKGLYDTKRTALEQSRQNLQEVFARRGRNLQAARQLLRYAQDLVIRNRAGWSDARQYVEAMVQSSK